MEHPVWARLDPELRDQVDALLEADRKLPAAGRIRAALAEPKPGIYESIEMLAERSAELGHVWIRSSPPVDLDALLERVASLPQSPDAIEAIWDCDSFGYSVDLVAVTLQPPADHRLTWIKHGSDRPHRDASGPTWPEAREATSLGRALADRLGVPFHFPDPDHPEFDAPRWSPK